MSYVSENPAHPPTHESLITAFRDSEMEPNIAYEMSASANKPVMESNIASTSVGP